jgi:hypothetical protein
MKRGCAAPKGLTAQLHMSVFRTYCCCKAKQPSENTWLDHLSALENNVIVIIGCDLSP